MTLVLGLSQLLVQSHVRLKSDCMKIVTAQYTHSVMFVSLTDLFTRKAAGMHTQTIEKCTNIAVHIAKCTREQLPFKCSAAAI